jgi:hypothetical protein
LEGLYVSQDEKEFLGVGDFGDQLVIRHVEDPAFTGSII